MAGATYYKFNMELPMLWVNLKKFDNNKLAEIIVSKGDEQDRSENGCLVTVCKKRLRKAILIQILVLKLHLNPKWDLKFYLHSCEYLHPKGS